jgi:phospholipid/cholesterol/gamma-HCH transport system substrate-binding protein
MALMEERDARFRNLERKAGVFLSVAVACVAASVILIGVQRDLFRVKHRVRLLADSGLNLTPGQPVKYKGFRIGKVDRVALDPAGQVEVELVVFGDYLGLIHEDSVAELRPENAIGDFVIEISGGSPGARPLAGGGAIAFRRALTLNDVAGEVQARFAGGMAELKRVTAEIPPVIEDLHATLDNSRRLTAQLIETQARLDARIDSLGRGLDGTVASINGEVLPSLTRSSQATEELLESSRKTVATLNRRLPDLMTRADRTLAQVEVLGSDLRRSSGELPRLVQDAGVLLHESQVLVDSMQQVWPIRRYVTPLQDKRRQVDGYE